VFGSFLDKYENNVLTAIARGYIFHNITLCYLKLNQLKQAERYGQLFQRHRVVITQQDFVLFVLYYENFLESLLKYFPISNIDNAQASTDGEGLCVIF